MMFQNYHYEKPEEFPQLEVGDYLARIEAVVDKVSNSNNSYVEITLSIQGHPNCNPNKMFYYDIPREGDPKANGQTVTKDDVKKACQKLSRFLDAFKIPSNMASNIIAWKGKTGLVHCDWQYDPNESDKKSKKYKQLTPKLEKKEDKPAEQAPAQSGDFPEDIIF